MDGWWHEIEDEIVGWLAQDGELTAAELGRRLGISERATASLLAVLAASGRVRIAAVTLEDSRPGWARGSRSVATPA